MPEVLLKRWNDWSAGVGHPIDEGNPGMHTANKILGLRGELRPAPKATDVTVGADLGHQFQYFFEEPTSAPGAPLFDAASGDTDTATSTLSWTHTTATQADRIVMAAFTQTDDQLIVGQVTCDGVTMLSLGARGLGGSRLVQAFYCINQAIGSNTITATFDGAQDEVVGMAVSYYNVDQTGPLGDGATNAGTNDAGPATVNVASGSSEMVVDFAACTTTMQTMAVGAGQTQRRQANTADMRLSTSEEGGSATTTMSWTLGAATDWATIAWSLVGSKANSYLYAQRGKKAGSASTVKVNKVSLANSDFANLETGQHDLTPLTVPGQPVRYDGFWRFPLGDNQKARSLTVIGSGAVSNDTLTATANQLGADHFANLGSQVAATLTHSVNDDGGLRILKVGGSIGLEADWGPAFPVGDRTERAAGLRALASLGFQLNVEGLFSFNKSARSGLVFEDFRPWRHAFDNIPIVPWKGGLIMSHPTGLLFWELGKLPVNVGLNADIGSSVLSPSGPSGLRGGRYHGLSPTGDFLWHIYQPDISSTTVNVMVAYPREDSPYDLVFQQLGTTTLQDTDHMLGCFVSVSSKPLSAEYVTPTLWYGNDDDLSYVVLGTTASPFRTRADEHATVTAGDAYMSELLFDRPTDLTRMIVHVQNMSSGDEWQLKVLADGEAETNLGPPLKRNGRYEISIDRHDVYRLMLHVNWATTVTSDRAVPSIQLMDLYGDPDRELPSAG